MTDATVRLKPGSHREVVPSTSIPEKPRYLGDYRILREIGRGGMGIVYEAEQQSLHRRVALKVMSGVRRWDAHARKLFEREARSAARLHHTNIVPVFDVGEEGDVCFYAMQFIPSIGLDVLLERLSHSAGRESNDLPAELRSPAHPEHFRTLARIGVQVATGLAHAHARGVIHRDIKPANLLLDEAGVVWITDFGLAKHADDNLTQPGDFFGTLRYMAPECFGGSGNARSDLYALGATLYELISRQPAFPKLTDPGQVELLATHPIPPSRIEPRVPRDLETIVLKAMDKDSAQRYESADALADDLRRFLADEPIRARPIGVMGRIVRWARRRPVPASLTAAVFLLTVTLIVGAVTAAVTFRRQATTERQLLAEALFATQQVKVALQHANDQTEFAVAANNDAQELSNFLLGILDETDPLALSGRIFGGKGGHEGHSNPTQVLDRALTKITASADMNPKMRAALLDKIGSIYTNLGHAERAGRLLEQALAIRQAEYGADSLEAAATWHNLGALHQSQLSVERADAAFSQALHIREAELSADHPLVSVTLVYLGCVKAFEGRNAEAVSLLRRALANHSKRGDTESRDYGIALAIFVSLLLDQEQIGEAAELMPKAMSLIKKHDGNNGLVKAGQLFLEARMAGFVGLHAVTTKKHKEAIRLAENGLGEGHFLAQCVRGALAKHYHEKVADLGAAEAEYRTILRLSEKSVGAHSSPAACAKMYLARVLRDQKRLPEAETLLREASAVMRDGKHVGLGRCLHILWEVCDKQGKGREALPILVEAVQERKKVGETIWYSNAAANLADELEKLGKIEQAVVVLRDSNLYLSRQKSLSPEDRLTLACRCACQCRLSRELPGRGAERDEAARIAIDSLRELMTAGHKNAHDLERETSLRPLHDRPAYQKLLADGK